MKMGMMGVLLCLLLAACGGRELADVTLVEALAVDKAEGIILTAAGEDKTFTAAGKDLEEAREALNAQGDRTLEVTHVAQLILGPGVEVGPVLWEELTRRDSGATAAVWLSDVPAGALLENCGSAAGRLTVLNKAGAAAPSLMEAVGDLARKGEVILPVLGLEEGELGVTGLRVWKGGLDHG